MLKLCLVGGLGRMGRAIASLVAQETDVEIQSVWETGERGAAVRDYGGATGYIKNPVTIHSDGRGAVGPCDVVVDFSAPGAFDEIVRICAAEAKPLVTGTTAIQDKDRRLEPLAEKVAVVSSPNMAMGVNVLFGLCGLVGRVLAGIADVEIIEWHHRTKKDVPSGTALEIARRVAAHTGKRVVVGRAEGSQQREDEIVIHSLRVGEVPGRHISIFSLKGETLEINHTAQSRDCFAAGALRAARFAQRADPGLYTMLDVLNLKSVRGDDLD